MATTSTTSFYFDAVGKHVFRGMTILWSDADANFLRNTSLSRLRRVRTCASIVDIDFGHVDEFLNVFDSSDFLVKFNRNFMFAILINVCGGQL